MDGDWGSGKTYFIKNKFVRNNKNIIYIPLNGIKNIDGSEIISLFKNISDYVIVFDDLERCEMPISEILGYINDYVEHKNVKCVIVANEQEINKKIDISKIKSRILNMYEENKKYKAIKEKLIGITIKYIPDINKVYYQLIMEYKKIIKIYMKF